ncbi:MAG: site-specific integrase [Lentisphaerae bacterium]|jgi:integrase|nr:site-specific integrase [Lentisphaerota bacterium]MBT5609579.1 site-specific integrase [Lentisphaerota bacterium]MBT7057775.1 site-specific integrase [Lentisphaerota bacterium]MBT7843194.1 site-specific integrase [Lentisphaerota bacterium]
MARRTKGRLYTRRSKKHGAIYWLDYSINGERFRQKLTDDDGQPITREKPAEAASDRILRPYTAKTDAERRRLAADALGDAEARAQAAEEATKPKLPIAEMWERHPYKTNTRGTTERSLSATTVRDNLSQWSKFEKWAEAGGIRFAEDVTADIAGQFRKDLLASGTVSGDRINKIVLLCRVMFQLAGIEPNPFAGLRKRNHKPQGRREFTTGELKSVCQSADGELRALLAVGLYTGLRLGDSATLDWSEVADDLSKLVREPSKTSYKGKKLVLPLHPVLQAILAETPAPKREGDVMPSLAAVYRDSRSALTKRIQDHFRSCGIRLHKPGTGYVRNANGSIKRTGTNSNEKEHTGRRAVVEVGFHSLRHSFVSICAREGVPLHVVQALCGHASPQIQELYLHASPTDASNAIAAFPAITELDTESTDHTDHTDRDRLAGLARSLPIVQVRALLNHAASLASK